MSLNEKTKNIKKKKKMKGIASNDFVADELEMFDDDGLCQSTNSLKMVAESAEDETSVNFIAHRASSNSNLQKTADSESTITHARSENTIPNLIKKKNRLISTDSGFGSYGPCELYNSSSVDSMANARMPRKCTSIQTESTVNEISHEEPQSPSMDTKNVDNLENDDQISPLASEAAVAESTPKSKKQLAKLSLNQRNTTMNSIDDNFVLDPKLINRDDGFHEVQCYINEHGSPIVREKRQKNRKKSTLREELKARSLGASYDDNLLRKDANKTPTCVSFSRLFKKLRETFSK